MLKLLKQRQFFCFNPVLIITFLIGFIQCAYSEPSNNINKTYCPSKIICLKNDDLSSCSHTSQDSLYWRRITYTSYPQRVVVGEYKFHLVDAPYHASYVPVSDEFVQDNMLICHYLNNGESLGIVANPEPNLEAYKSIAAKWDIIIQPARCFSESPTDCPLKEANSLAIFNDFDSSLYISGVPIYFNQGGLGYYTVRYDDIVSRCYESNLCTLDISTPSDGIIGSVVVDLDDAMRIKKIIHSENSIATITQNTPFNSIRIEKSSEPKPFVSISNQINSNLLLTVNGKINLTLTSRQTATIRSNLISSACSGYRKCTLNIGINSEQPNVGTITVDMQDNMKILEVVSARASQILVRRSDANNSVEVSYPYFKQRK